MVLTSTSPPGDLLDINRCQWAAGAAARSISGSRLCPANTGAERIRMLRGAGDISKLLVTLHICLYSGVHAYQGNKARTGFDPIGSPKKTTDRPGFPAAMGDRGGYSQGDPAAGRSHQGISGLGQKRSDAGFAAGQEERPEAGKWTLKAVFSWTPPPCSLFAGTKRVRMRSKAC